MYIPKSFEVTDQEEAFAFIQANAFGQLISSVGGRHFSTHVPFLLSEDRANVVAHLARQNSQHVEIDGQEVLITFAGPHDYISPAWYGGQGVPTWNYQAVHIYGTCTVFHDPDRLKTVVDRLTNIYESGFETPWQPNYEVAMLGAIVGIEVVVNAVQCKYKLSQNRSVQDRKQVIRKLKENGSEELARAMERNEGLCVRKSITTSATRWRWPPDNWLG